MLPSLDPVVLTIFREWSLRQGQVNISSRFLAIINDIDQVRRDDPFAKFVVFSQYSESLQALKVVLEGLRATTGTAAQNTGQQSDLAYTDFSCVLVDGHGSPANKQESLKRFNEAPYCNVCLLTTGTAATGLTLTVSRVCYMLEPVHNAAEEAQALNRVHRIGQAKSVRCVIFYVENSVEERLLALRKSTGSLTELIANSDTFDMDAVDVVEGEHGISLDGRATKTKKKEEKKKEVKKKQCNVSKTVHTGNSKGIFFSASQLQLLFGSTDERRARATASATSTRGTGHLGARPQFVSLTAMVNSFSYTSAPNAGTLFGSVGTVFLPAPMPMPSQATTIGARFDSPIDLSLDD